jgi:ribosomal protein L29
MSTPLHDADFYSWTREQAALLRERRLDELDAEHLIEELLDLGASQERELESRLAVLIAHLLKWRYQPEWQGKSWRATIKEQRYRIARLLQKNPGLKSQLDDAFDASWFSAVQKAVKETPFDEDDFPEHCPFAQSEVLDANFWPESDGT